MKHHWGEFYDDIIKHYPLNYNSIPDPAMEAFFKADSDYVLHCSN